MSILNVIEALIQTTLEQNSITIHLLGNPWSRNCAKKLITDSINVCHVYNTLIEDY
jgi:hypothetical protein